MDDLITSRRAGEVREPLLDVPIGQALRDAATECPDRVAVISGVPDPAARRRLTYAQLLAGAQRTAAALLRRYAPGERIAVWAPNVPEWLLLYYGVALAGMTLVTVNPAYGPGELEFVLRRSRARALFLLPEFRGNPMARSAAAVADRLPAPPEIVPLTAFEEFLAGDPGTAPGELPVVRPDDPMALIFTSGTTGSPKGALQHHRGMLNNAWSCARAWAGGDHEVNVNPVPFFHSGGCVLAVLGAVTTRATLVAITTFQPGLALELIESCGGTTVAGVPTMFVAMAEHPDAATRDLSTLRALGSGGSQLRPELTRRLEDAFGVPCINVYGQTECSIATMTTLADTPADRAETVGRPMPHVEIQVAAPDGEAVEVGEVGEVLVRGYPVMLGYDGLAAETAAAVDPRGWLRTGDLGTLDARGYLRIEGRLTDMIIRGGENIYPREIETVLTAHPDVAEAAVVGVPDDRWGERVAAFVRPEPGRSPEPEQLRVHVRSALAHFKVPEFWEFVEDYPLTPTGKIKKFALRDAWVERSGRPGG